MTETAHPSEPAAARRPSAPPAGEAPRRLSILGVEITDLTMQGAIDLLAGLMRKGDGVTRLLYFVNAHTLNVATENPEVRDVINRADLVFGDGSGVRVAARLQGIRVRANLNGTDLMPALFERTAGQGFRYYMLGADPDSIERAAATARARFPGWELVGHHHGYVLDGDRKPVIEAINRAEPHLLLVGMGNPLQEQFLHDHREYLRVPLCAGTGGLFDHWAGNLERAPLWVRKLGMEWVQLLLQQPHKARRYLLGNPKYLYRVGRERLLGAA